MALINTTTTGVLGSTFYGDGTGSLTVQQNGVTLGTYGNIPTFSAYLASNQTITTTVWTKITCQTEEFDTNSNYDNATNYRFTPTVAGYYQVNGSHITATASTQANVSIYKNGVSFKAQQAIGAYAGAFVSAVIYFNGTTDYVELWGLLVGTTPSFASGAANTFFSAILIKAA